MLCDVMSHFRGDIKAQTQLGTGICLFLVEAETQLGAGICPSGGGRDAATATLPPLFVKARWRLHLRSGGLGRSIFLLFVSSIRLALNCLDVKLLLSPQ